MGYRAPKIDYSNRTVDMLLLQFIAAPVPETEVLPDISDTPRIVTGIEKLVQRFALIFLTNIGSVKHVETEGTEFLDKLRTGHIYDDSTLRSAALKANNDTRLQIRIADAELDTPEDEALANSEVIGLETIRSTATVKVSIRITTVSGDTYTYVTPITAGV